MWSPIRPALALTLLTALTTPLAAQRTVQECRPGDDRPGGASTSADQPRQAGEYDVVLHVPDLCVERIELNVQGLEAHLALNARVANLVRLDAGADVTIDNVDLGIYGLRAEAQLLVDLDNVVFIVDRTLAFIDNNADVLTGVLKSTQGALGTVGDLGQTALRPDGPVSGLVGSVGRTLDNVSQPGGLLSQTVNTLGQTVQRTVGETGSIVERTLDSAGSLVNERTVGQLMDLPLVREATNTAGQTVRTVRDTSGKLIEYVMDSAGKVSNVRVLNR